jgi:preprotein translocase subunit SecA
MNIRRPALTARRLQGLVAAVNAIESTYIGMTDAELRSLTDAYRERHAHGETLDDLLPEAFATVREAARRVLGQRPYDEQVMGATVMHFGSVAEMKTSEGKTLAAVLPAYLNALPRCGVHIATVNDYLADRDAGWMHPVYRFLGLSVGTVRADRPPAEHREAYQADVTYGVSSIFGFDYLRDNLAISVDELVQRGHHYAIVDEVDSVLIDEARAPLLVSAPSQHPREPHERFADLASRLQPGPEHDYVANPAGHTVSLTDGGIRRVENELGVDNLHNLTNAPSLVYLMTALRAKELFTVERDYLVQGGEIAVVDEISGRLMPGRRYEDGIHQAIEAKEGLTVRPTRQILATITQRSYYRLYDKLAGMTGTAKAEESEFQQGYGMGVVVVPTHRPTIRTDRPDLIYRTVDAKYAALVKAIARRHQRGQPVLVGTASVEESEQVSDLLKRRDIPHSVLNARHHAREAEIVAQAGRTGAVTVATAMAGRGTDIVLGGNPQLLARLELRERGADEPDEVLARWERVCAEEAAQVLEAGGLCVLGSHRNALRRLDDQLRGRSGRQGDPGESQFYLSLHDDLLLRTLKSGALEALMLALKIPDDAPIESNAATNQIRFAQARSEAGSAHYRRQLIGYDQVLDDQCAIIYGQRRRILAGEDIRGHIAHMIDDVIARFVQLATTVPRRDWDLVALVEELSAHYPVADELRDLPDRPLRARPDAPTLVALFTADAHRAYERREADLGVDRLDTLERDILLNVIDRLWRDHIEELAVVRDSVELSFLAGMDPLVEYHRRASERFADLVERIKRETVGRLFYHVL